MKKIYVKPAVDVEELFFESNILTASVNATAEDVTESEGSWGE